MALDDQVVRNVDIYTEQLKKRLHELGNRAVKKATHDLFGYMEIEIGMIFRDIVDEYYADYSPLFYNRNESLYNILITGRSENPDNPTMFIELDPGMMTGYRSGYQGGDGLYDTVFRKGWHGGADKDKNGMHPDEGTPYYRTPYPYHEGDTTGYWNWGYEADRMKEAPIVMFANRLQEAASGRFADEYKRLIQQNTAGIKIE